VIFENLLQCQKIEKPASGENLLTVGLLLRNKSRNLKNMIEEMMEKDCLPKEIP